MAQEMETFAARLASFDLVLNPDKRRSSTTKSAKRIAWPHRKPSPAELAHAGFFYNPYGTNPDNTTCFLCGNALDGWEEEDNPITEHLKHAKDCGWAVMMDIQQHSSNPAEIDDPTSDKIRDARLATFGTQWPHDGKRGWTCDSEKMVDGGWYFCPTEESNDLASCAYCKLSLDGWEPKDDPFNEHYRRSPDCSFFVFAQPPGKKGKGKGAKSKRGRPSKASSRMSAQSTASEAPVSDMEDVMDQDIAPQASTKTKATKKSSKSKLKTSRSKKEDPVETGSQMSVVEPELIPQNAPKPKRTRGRKRTSDDVEEEEQGSRDAELFEQPERPSKKRATKTRNSAQQSVQGYESVAESEQDHSILQEENKKSRGTGKKRGRKPSSASTSKSASVSRGPRDSEIDAALEADLEANEAESVDAQPKSEPRKKTSSAKSKTKKKQKATPDPETVVSMDDQAEDEIPDDMYNGPEDEVDVVEEPTQKKKSTKGSKSRSSNNLEDGQESLGTTKSERMSPEVQAQEPRSDSEQEPVNKSTKKGSKKKASAEKSKKSRKADKAAAEPSTSEEVPERQAEQRTYEDVDRMEEENPESQQDRDVKQEPPRRRSSKVPPKTAQRYSDIPHERLYARSLAGSRSSGARSVLGETNQDHEAVSPLPSASKSTSSLSPQSSDAENHPPSMKPVARPHVASSPSKQPVRIPMAPSTPSPSKQNANRGGLNTSHPWKPIDIDELILANPSDPENFDFSSALSNIKGDLTSPEKKMSVEEWIQWNAKNGEQRLKRECERLVGQFEREGARAMRVLEGIECID
ncbi:hypothetical protein BDV59DRAFT_144371 [Aspergillus ambiguus]|uniref:baculoviral IAP repeat-containing protein n=1 Tax=Aspergillus ambiguus TaxID=176160 RepID=UPI003CCD975B